MEPKCRQLDRSWRKKPPDESLGGLEVAAAQEKDQLIARRAQARGDVLERRGKVEAAFAFDAIENRREVEHLGRSTLLRIFMRGMGGSRS
jgi:hypothetical protein